MQKTKMSNVRSRVERGLCVAAALFATIGLAPAARADAGGADSNDDTSVTIAGRSASASELREGDDVRASYQDANDARRAIRIEPKREGERKVGTGEGQNVQTMSPDDPEWDQVHQGG